MAQLGILPTKTTVELREPDGDAGTIPAATEASAGVMTAGHVKMLREVYQRVQQNGDNITALTLPGTVPDLTQYVTRSEVQQVLSRLPALQAQQQPHREPIDITPRVNALEQAITKLRQPAPVQLGSMPNSLETRVQLLETRQTELEDGLLQVATTVGEIEQMLKGLHDLVTMVDTDEVRAMA